MDDASHIAKGRCPVCSTRLADEFIGPKKCDTCETLIHAVRFEHDLWCFQHHATISIPTDWLSTIDFTSLRLDELLLKAVECGLSTNDEIAPFLDQARAAVGFPDRNSDIIESLSTHCVLSKFQLRELSRGKQGFQIGSYVATDVLRRGRMTDTYLAYHKVLRHSAAVKIFRGIDNEDRCKRTSQILASLGSPLFPECYSAGNVGERTYLALEYIGGIDIPNTVSVAPPPIEISFVILVQICRSLIHLETLGLEISSLRPRHIITDSHGRIRNIAVASMSCGLRRNTDRVGNAGSEGDDTSRTADYVAWLSSITRALLSGADTHPRDDQSIIKYATATLASRYGAAYEEAAQICVRLLRRTKFGGYVSIHEAEQDVAGWLDTWMAAHHN